MSSPDPLVLAYREELPPHNDPENSICVSIHLSLRRTRELKSSFEQETHYKILKNEWH